MADTKSPFMKSPFRIPKIKQDCIEPLEQTFSHLHLCSQSTNDSQSACGNLVNPRESTLESSSTSSISSTPCKNDKDIVPKLKQKPTNLTLPKNVQNFLAKNYYSKKSPTPSAVPIPLKIENTYRIEPNITFKSRAKEIQEAARNVLEIHLKKMEYRPDNCGEMTRNLSMIVKNKLKELIPPRYKIICQTFIGQQGGQGIEIATRCLWSVSTDSYEVVDFKNDSIIATVIIHGIYFE